MARVTTRQLRFYDQCGLLQPSHIDTETGYRYYSATQLPQLYRILALKDLGLTLEQIARLIDDKISPAEMRGMLTMKKAQIEQILQEEILRLQSVEERIRQIDDLGQLRDYEITVHPVETQQFLSTRQTIASLQEGLALAHELNHLLPIRAGRAALGHLVVMIHSEGWSTENIDVEIGYLVEVPIVDTMQLANGQVLTLRTLPEVNQMASVIRVGLLADKLGCYGILATWMEENDYQPAGIMREVFIEPLQPGRENDAVIEIQIPVQKINRSGSLIETGT